MENIYPTPEPSVFLGYLTNVNVSVPIKPKGVKCPDINFTSLRNEPGFPNPPEKPLDFPNVEPAILIELRRQINERYYDFR